MKRIRLIALIPIAVALLTYAPLPAAERPCSNSPAGASGVDRVGSAVPAVDCTGHDVVKHVGRNVLAAAAGSPTRLFALDPRSAIGILLAIDGLRNEQRALHVGQRFIASKPP